MVGKRIEQVAKRVSRGFPFRLSAFLAATYAAVVEKCRNKLRNFIKYPSLASKLSTSAISATLHHSDFTQWISHQYLSLLCGYNFTYLYSYIYAP